VNILRDQIWQFLGSLVAVIALAVSIYAFVVQRRKKSVSYQVLTATDLLTVKDEISGKLKIFFDEVPIQSASLIIVKIINDGNLPIASTDFERPLSFSCGEGADILSVEVTESSPNTLRPELIVESNKVHLAPMLLNSRDTITFKLLATQFQGEVEPDARIIGISTIKRISGRSRRDNTLIVTIGFGVVAVIGLISIGLSHLFNWSDDITVAVFFSAGIATGIMFGVAGSFGKWLAS
jgi:hypothetical protein